ncbi:MAG: DinB family protein [Comamonadaceae bacterium]|nr:MAG: DinB family protein [Comamonadaceae bacterium]
MASYHLEGLTTQECLWRPAAEGLHVRQTSDGNWHADWPAHEGYSLGPSSIAWLTWHMGFWWSMVLDHTLDAGTLTRESLLWPGTADGVRAQAAKLHGRWSALLEGLDDSELQATERTRWPFKDRPFGDVVAWANVELTKSAAEIGYARFLHAGSLTDADPG